MKSLSLIEEGEDNMYQFTDDCLTGLETIDNEHRQLFQSINEISDVLMDETKNAEEVLQSSKNLMATLKKYAATHFAHEEDYMREIHDPELLRQKREHAEFTTRVNSSDWESMDVAQGIRVLQDMMEYLSLWLYRHILSSDTLIGKMKTVHDNPVMLTFSEEYYTGVDIIDREHQRLFEILADLNDLNRKDFVSDKYDAIVDVVEELKDYTVKHFQDEERYMESIQYEGLSVQQNLHKTFIDKMDQINLNDVDENQQAYIDVLIDFLANWLINHIMKMDQKIPVVD